jgi:hypothetical protein
VPQTVTKQVPTEVWYTKPVHEKTTKKWLNTSARVLVPFWKKVTMTVNVTIPINTVRYKKVVKLVSGNETVLKKVFVPRSSLPTGNKTKLVKPMEDIELGAPEHQAVTTNPTVSTERTLPGPLAYKKTVYEPQKEVVQRPEYYRTQVPQEVVNYKPVKVTEKVKVPLPSWEKDSKTYRNVTSWAPVEHTVHIVKPVAISFMTQELKWVHKNEVYEVETTTRGDDRSANDRYYQFENGDDQQTDESAPAVTPDMMQLQDANITYTTYKTLPGPLAYKKMVYEPKKVVVQRPVVYRTYVPEQKVHYESVKHTDKVKIPLPSWEQESKTFHNATRWEPVAKTLHILKKVAIEFDTEELKMEDEPEEIEHVTDTRGDDEEDDSNRYIDYSGGGYGEYVKPDVEELEQEPLEDFSKEN